MVLPTEDQTRKPLSRWLLLPGALVAVGLIAFHPATFLKSTSNGSNSNKIASTQSSSVTDQEHGHAETGVLFGRQFPALTGRIVDQAHIISQQSQAVIEPKLKNLEMASGIQLVVATVPSLEGQEIDPYATGLFNTWRLGQKDKNNGVLLLVAPKEHRVRIEVGYGLENVLTNPRCAAILTGDMIPRFKSGDHDGAIEHGVDSIIATLTTESVDSQKGSETGPETQSGSRPPGGEASGDR